MTATHLTLVPWRVDGPTTLHGFDDDLVYMLVCADTTDPELQRQVALVSAWDLEGEGYARMIAAVPKLLAACQAVVVNWEHGDLAQAARFCAEAVQTAIPGSPAAHEQQANQLGKTRRVEYYRLWGGDSGTWDTDFLDIPADTPDDKIGKAIRRAAGKIQWRDGPPVIVGYYGDADEQGDEDDGREKAIGDLLAKAEAASLKAEDLDEIVHELVSSIAADINNSGMDGQLAYLIGEMGGEAVGKELDRLATEKVPKTTAAGDEEVHAECHSDDRVYSAEFNAVRWFEQADDSEVLALTEDDWGDSYAADRVGMFMADIVPGVQKMFDYVEHYDRAHKKHIGWVCTVNKADVLQWLRAHRPQLYQSVLKIDEGVDS